VSILCFLGTGVNADSVIVDFTLSDGLQLLYGNLHFRYPLKQRYILQINKPGIYFLTGTFNAYGVKNSRIAKQFPTQTTVYFYAREDTIAFFLTPKAMEQAIQDSLIFRISVIAEKRFCRELRQKRSKTVMPFSITQYYLDYTGTLKNLLSDSISANQLSKYYTPDQIRTIQVCNLMYSPPSAKRIKLFSEIDFQSSISLEKLSKMEHLIGEQLTELYQLDQTIIYNTNFDTYLQLLAKRGKLLQTHLKERKILFYSTWWYNRKIHYP